MTPAAAILPLELSGVNFLVDGKRFLKDIDLTFGGRGASMIIGPNGAGKSLLLKVCHGLVQPSSGSVTWVGSAAGTDPTRQQAMVFQRPVMLRRLARANVEYPLKLRGVPRAERRERALEALKLAGLGRYAELPARVLSFGEQQRLAVARAWAQRPQVLFLDEPTSSLDPASTHSIERMIADIRDTGTRVIMTTHDMGQAQRLGFEVLFMHRGRIFERASVDHFFSSPQNDLARAFLKGELLWWKKKNLDQNQQEPNQRRIS